MFYDVRQGAVCSWGKVEQSLGSAPSGISLWPSVSGTLDTACTLVRNQVVWSPCFKDSSGRSSCLWLLSPTLLIYRMCYSGPSSSYPIISGARGWRLWLYQARATSHARMALATQCWESHQGRQLSLGAELLVFFFPGLPWVMPSEWSWKGCKPLYLEGTRGAEDWGGGGRDSRSRSQLLPREGFIALAVFGTWTAQNSHPSYTSEWAAMGDSFVSRPSLFLKFLSPLYCKG